MMNPDSVLGDVAAVDAEEVGPHDDRVALAALDVDLDEIDLAGFPRFFKVALTNWSIGLR